MKDLEARLAGQNVSLELSETAKTYIAREGYDPVYGARPLKRFIQRNVETSIARFLISGEVKNGSTIHVDLLDDQLNIVAKN